MTLYKPSAFGFMSRVLKMANGGQVLCLKVGYWKVVNGGQVLLLIKEIEGMLTNDRCQYTIHPKHSRDRDVKPTRHCRLRDLCYNRRVADCVCVIIAWLSPETMLPLDHVDF